MSSLDKLLIRGIRSFSPYSENVIEFYTPLTIIVGHNGAGKTTIIECLKYAASGDLPPNSKGGAFVHDPKISREVEVKGQIKLKFKNVRGQAMVCTRSLQSTQRKTKLEQKTLESLLMTTDPATGEQLSISSRCAEMDAEIPLQLGVSRAVLDNVLFCHQEESFWPLSEPSVLKRKFDDIFAATQYTKTLDALKAIRKEMAQELKLEQQKLDHLKLDRDKAHKLQIEIEGNTRRIEEGRARVAGIEAQIESVSAIVDRLNSEMHSLTTLQHELEHLQHDLQTAQLAYDDLKGTLHEMVEPNEILKEMLERLSQRTLADDRTIEGLRTERVRFETIRDQQSQEYSKIATSRRVLEIEAKKLSERQQFRTALMIELCQTLSLPPTTDVMLLVQLAGQKITNQRQDLQSTQTEIKTIDSQFANLMQTLTARQSSLLEGRRMKRKSMEEMQRKLASIMDQLADASQANELLEELQIRMLDEEASLNHLRQIYEAANYDARLSILGGKKGQLEAELDDVNTQLVTLNRTADARTRLEFKQTELERKQEATRKLWLEIGQDLQVACDNSFAMEEAEECTERAWKAREKQYKALKQDRERVHAQVALIDSKLEHAKMLCKRKEDALSEKTIKVDAVCAGQGFAACVQEAEGELQQVDEQLSSSLSSKAIYGAFSAAFSTKKSCPLCERSFESRMDEEIFGRKLSHLLSALPTLTVEAEAKRRALEGKLHDLKTLRPVSDDVNRLKSVEIPELRVEIGALQEERERSQNNLDDIDTDLSRVTLEERRLSLLRKRTEELGRLLREGRTLKGDVDILMGDLQVSGSTLSINELHDRLGILQNDLQRIRKEMEQISNEMRSRQNELHAKESRFRDLKEQAMKIQLEQAKILQLQQNEAELEGSIATLVKDLATLEMDSNKITEDLEACKGRHRQEMAIAEEREERLRGELEINENTYRRLLTINEEIDRMQETCNAQMAGQLSQKMEEIEGQLKETQQAINDYTEKMAIFSKQASEALLQERNIQDNLRYRELDSRIHILRDKIRQVQTKLGGPDRLSVTQQLQNQELCRNELMGERSGLFGELRQLEDQMARMRRNLEADYRTIESDYCDQFVKCNATSAVIQDLEKYAKALDQAIIKFHSYKMAELNRIIKEIWTSTYQGADIDTIEIRTDHETATGIGGRSYNYRVVMVKGDTVLDMRGRSSAGQRVLASLIIRLALAETFGQHCGVLALDEPTTNLDRDNIESLANALAEYISIP